MEKVSMSHEDYLEAIVILGGTCKKSVRSVDIANKMGVSKASVSKAVSALRDRGFLVQPLYGDVTLTQEGFDYANRVLERHNLLVAFLTKEVGIAPDVAQEEACAMEHAISDESFSLWKAYMEKLSLAQ